MQRTPKRTTSENVGSLAVKYSSTQREEDVLEVFQLNLGMLAAVLTSAEDRSKI